MLSNQDQATLNRLTRRVRERFPEARIWAFGSRARGNAEPDSDLDVCIVLERVTEEDEALIQHLAWEVGFENGVIFNVIALSEEEFERGPMSASTLKRNILREGLAV